MKKIFTIFAAIFIAVSMVLPEMANAQAPGKMSYQAVIRNSEGGLLANTQLGIQISILQGAATGTSVYSETQTPTTNSNGLVSIEIGGGEDFNAIDWGNGVYFIKTETDPAGGTDYSITGTSQIMSVPYALNAKTADNGITATQATTLAATSGTNTGDQDVSGIETNATAVSALQAEQTTQDAAIASNTAKSGITEEQAATLAATSGTNTGDQNVSGIAANATAVSALQAEQAIQDAAIASNTAKSGITEEQAATLAATSGTNTGDQDISGIATNTAAIALNTAKVGVTTAQADIVANTSGTNTGDQDITGIATNATAIALNTAKVGYTEALVSANTNVAANTAKVGYTEALVSANTDVAANTAKNSEADGTSSGDMKYWNGNAWVVIPTTINEGATLQLIGGVPTWAGGTAPPPTVTSLTGRVWMDRNLGATQVATSSTDAAAYGGFYQWGRDTDGHQLRTSSTTSTLSAGDTPGHGDFITNPSSPFDWRSPQNNNLWQGVSGINNPCPAGYRIPTSVEWSDEKASWSTGGAAGAFASPLKLPAAGRRTYNNATVEVVGIVGSYWASDISVNFANYVELSGYGNQVRAQGHSIRCIKD
jgi:hypothetical protein